MHCVSFVDTLTVTGVFVLVLKLEVTEESKRIASSLTSAPPPDDSDLWDFELQCRTEMRTLQEIENLEERISGASLQTKVSIGVTVSHFVSTTACLTSHFVFKYQ